MFGDPVTNPKGYKIVELQEVCTRITDGTHQPPKWSTEGVPFLFVSNVGRGTLSFEVSKFISDETYGELTRRCPIEVNDILYTIVGSYGNAALVETTSPFAFQRHIAHIKPNQKIINPEFLLGVLLAEGVKRQADKQVRGVAQKTLNLSELKQFEIIYPPISIQTKYVEVSRKIKELLRKSHYWAARADSLFHSLQQRAFSGELFSEKALVAPPPVEVAQHV